MADTVPNKPEQAVVVSVVRKMLMRFRAKAGQTLEVPERWAGVSSRDVSAEQYHNPESQNLPITWRFIAGQPCGGDNLEYEPAWHFREIKIDSAIEDARPVLEERFFGSAFDGFVWHVAT